MKKGCFFTVLIILTIIIAAVIYMFKNHKDDVYGLFKPMVLDNFTEELTESLKKNNITANKDSITSIVNNYIEHARNKSNFRLEELGHFFSRFELIVSDGVVDSSELAALKNIFEEEKQNERSEENRN